MNIPNRQTPSAPTRLPRIVQFFARQLTSLGSPLPLHCLLSASLALHCGRAEINSTNCRSGTLSNFPIRRNGIFLCATFSRTARVVIPSACATSLTFSNRSTKLSFLAIFGVPIVTEQNPTNFWGSRKRSPPQWSESGDQCFDGRDTFETFVLLFGAVFLEETGAGVWSGAGKYR